MSEGVEIRFLGTGNAFGSGGRLQTCFHVRSGDASFLIDCGASASIGLKRHGIDAATLNAIIISHYHGDHFAGVPFLLTEGRFSGRTTPLALGGPPGLNARVASATSVLFPGAGATFPFPVEYVDYIDRVPVQVGPALVTGYPVTHAPASLPHALRIEFAGCTIAYSGDTEWNEALIDVARGADIFICEVSGYDGPVGIHLDYATLLLHRPALECERLVLTHMGEEVLKHADHVAAELRATAAYDGLLMQVPARQQLGHRASP